MYVARAPFIVKQIVFCAVYTIAIEHAISIPSMTISRLHFKNVSNCIWTSIHQSFFPVVFMRRSFYYQNFLLYDAKKTIHVRN